MSTCTAHNGTYTCQRPMGHTGNHENHSSVVNAQNVRTGTRVATFADNYAPVRLRTVAA